MTIDDKGIVRFVPDAMLLAAVGGDGTLSRWRIGDFSVVFSVGSGYQHVTTVINFSPNAVYQSTASQGSITIQRRSDGSVVRILAGGALEGFTPVAFTPDSSAIAAWASSPNQTTLWRISDGAVLRLFPGTTNPEGVTAIRFTPDGTRLVTTGYLATMGADGVWNQNGIIRFWRVADGALRQGYSEHTGIGVTSPIAWSPDVAFFAYGTFEGTAVVARTPAP